MTDRLLLGAIYVRGLIAHTIIVRLWPARYLDHAPTLWRWAWDYAEWEATKMFFAERRSLSSPILTEEG